MFKKTLTGVALSVALATTNANAIDFSTTFTADNQVTDFQYSVGGAALQSFALTGISNLTDWKKSSSLSLTGLATASTYDFIWKVVNDGAPSSGNPAAFLAQFNLGGNTNYTSNASNWSISSDGTNWTSASLAAYSNKSGVVADAFNGGQNIWSEVNGTISGVDTAAQWIWASANGAQNVNPSLYIRASVVSPVSEPSTLLMMLAGLVGIAGFAASRRRKSAALAV